MFPFVPSGDGQGTLIQVPQNMIFLASNLFKALHNEPFDANLRVFQRQFFAPNMANESFSWSCLQQLNNVLPLFGVKDAVVEIADRGEQPSSPFVTLKLSVPVVGSVCVLITASNSTVLEKPNSDTPVAPSSPKLRVRAPVSSTAPTPAGPPKSYLDLLSK